MPQRTQVLNPTESRQASPRRLNFRVLVMSMLLAVLVAALLYYAVYDPRTPIGLPQQPPEQSTTAPEVPPQPPANP